MIETRLLSAWGGFVRLAALIALIVLAFCVMARTVRAGDLAQHVGAIVGIMILLVLLPAIITGLWSTMSLFQQVGMIVAVLSICLFLGSSRRKPKRKGQ